MKGNVDLLYQSVHSFGMQEPYQYIWNIFFDISRNRALLLPILFGQRSRGILSVLLRT